VTLLRNHKPVHSRHPLRAVITGSIARSAKRRYLSYLDADFDIFRPAGRHVATMGMSFRMEEGTEVPNFTTIGATIRV